MRPILSVLPGQAAKFVPIFWPIKHANGWYVSNGPLCLHTSKLIIVWLLKLKWMFYRFSFATRVTSLASRNLRLTCIPKIDIKSNGNKPSTISWYGMHFYSMLLLEGELPVKSIDNLNLVYITKKIGSIRRIHQIDPSNNFIQGYGF